MPGQKVEQAHLLVHEHRSRCQAKTELCGRGRKEEKSQKEESAHSFSAAVIAEIL